jgi:hypothetical protein
MLIVAIVVAIAAAVFGFVALRTRNKPLPAGWTAITFGNDYGAKVDPITGSLDPFPVLPDSAHYITHAVGGLGTAKGLRMRFRVKVDTGVRFLLMQLINGRETAIVGSTGLQPVLFFQRAGDDGSGRDKYETFRWWTGQDAVPLGPGEFEIVAMFSDRWTAVESSDNVSNPAAFRDALEGAARVGFTFPGMTGKGHGCCATGPASFDLLDFAIL